jgi:hypothetical protein
MNLLDPLKQFTTRVAGTARKTGRGHSRLCRRVKLDVRSPGV